MTTTPNKTRARGIAEDAQTWLARQFEFENCAECGRDHRHHTAIMLSLGAYGANWFARCDREPVLDENGWPVYDPENYEGRP